MNKTEFESTLNEIRTIVEAFMASPGDWSQLDKTKELWKRIQDAGLLQIATDRLALESLAETYSDKARRCLSWDDPDLAAYAFTVNDHDGIKEMQRRYQEQCNSWAT